MPAQEIKYGDDKYKYACSKHNVLIYVKQPEHFYDDWVENGGVLVVEYRPEANPKEAYYVLHEISVSEGSGYITSLDISNRSNRIAEPVTD